jgi:hypothetical protein
MLMLCFSRLRTKRVITVRCQAIFSRFLCFNGFICFFSFCTQNASNYLSQQTSVSFSDTNQMQREFLFNNGIQS